MRSQPASAQVFGVRCVALVDLDTVWAPGESWVARVRPDITSSSLFVSLSRRRSEGVDRSTVGRLEDVRFHSGCVAFTAIVLRETAPLRPPEIKGSRSS